MQSFYPHGEITKGYLDTFLYRPVRISAADAMGGVPDGELFIFNNLLGESYFPLFQEKDDVHLDIIEVIPKGKVNRARKKPEWWFDKGRDFRKRVTLYRPVSPSKETIPFVVRLGKKAPSSVDSSQMMLHAERFSGKFNRNAERFSKYIIDLLVGVG